MANSKSGITKRINLLTVPIDIQTEEQLTDTVKAFLADEGNHHIVLLDMNGLIRARGNSDFGKYVRGASLIIPTSLAIIRGTKFLNKRVPVRYMPFEFIIRLLGIMESLGQSVYFIGSRPKDLNIASANLRDSFPGLRIVGRHSGYYDRESEENIILAIKKAAPSILLAGNGLPGKDLWILANKKSFNPGIYIWCGGCYDIFSGRKKKVSKKLWEKGFQWIPDIIRHPWKIYRLFIRLYYLILLLIYKIRKF